MAQDCRRATVGGRWKRCHLNRFVLAGVGDSANTACIVDSPPVTRLREGCDQLLSDAVLVPDTEPGLRAALGPHPLLNSKFRMSESAVEKQVTTILSKLDLSEETQVHRRVAPVLTFLREANLSHAGTQ
jgi:hypothetical protein